MSYADWLVQAFGGRVPADPNFPVRALRIVAASLANVPDETIKNTFRTRLAQLPFLRKAFNESDAARESLGLSFERIIERHAGIILVHTDFVKAVTAALRGDPASITTRDGQVYDVRAVCLIQAERFPTVAYISSDRVIVDRDWRLHLLPAGYDELRDVLKARHKELSVTPDEAKALATELSQLNALDRLERLDQVLQGQAGIYYRSIRLRLNSGIAVMPDELVPANAFALRLYFALDSWNAESRAKELLDRNSFLTVFDRLSALPARIPNALIDQWNELAPSKRREHLRSLLKRPASPISILHVVRLMNLHLDPQTARRFLRRLVGRAVGADKSWLDYLKCVAWFAKELWRRPECSDWSAESLLIATWGHSHQMITMLAEAGFSYSALAHALPFKIISEVDLFGNADLVRAPSWPTNIWAEQLLVSGLWDALSTTPSLVDNELRALLSSVLRTSESIIPLSLGLYCALDSPDPIGSYLSSSRIEQLKLLLGDNLLDTDIATFSLDFAVESYRNAVTTESSAWVWLAVRTVGAVACPELLALVTASISEDILASELRSVDPTAWRSRLITLTNLVGSIQPEVSVDVWNKLVTFVQSNDGGEAIDALLLLAVYAETGRGASPEERTRRIFEALAFLLRQPGILAKIAGRVAIALRETIPGRQIDRTLSGAVLLARADL